MSAVCCFIKEQYFIDHASFAKMLDPGNTGKQSHRTYLCLKITSDGNDYYIPLRNNLGKDVRPYGRIGHSVPSSTRTDTPVDDEICPCRQNRDTAVQQTTSWHCP